MSHVRKEARIQHCPEHSEMEETDGQSGLSCGQQEEVSITVLQIFLSFSGILVFLLLSGSLYRDILLAG